MACDDHSDLSNPSISRNQLQFYCQNCDLTISRPMTEEELSVWSAYRTKEDSRIRNMHALSHKVDEALEEAAAHESDPEAALPEEVECIGVDDAYYASSVLAIVPHETEDYYWGTTVWYIPQCTGEAPISFFLYDNHARELLRVLESIVKKHDEKGDDGLPDWPEIIRNAKP